MNRSEYAYDQQSYTTEKNQLKILNCLRSVYPKSISSTELEQRTGLTRKTIIKHGRELKAKHLIRRNGQGKKAKYQITELAMGNMPQLSGKLFQSIAFDRIMPKTFDFIAGIEGLGAFMKTFGSQITTCQQLNAFSEALAAYMTNVLTESLCPMSFSTHHKVKDNFCKDIQIKNPGRVQDDLRKQHFKSAINLDKIFWEFSKLPCVQKGLKCNSKNAYSEDDPRWSMYELDDAEVFNDLKKTCETLNPRVFKELEKVRIQEIPIAIGDKLRTLDNKPSSDSIIKEPINRSFFY